MPTAHIERIDLASAEEVDGVYRSLTYRVRVTEVTDGAITALNTALGTSGVPMNGNTLAAYPNLVLRKRMASIVEGDPQTFDVDLVYEHFDNPGKSLNAPLSGQVVGQIRAHVQQLRSNKDINGNTVTLEHIWDPSDPERSGDAPKQSGEFSYYQPQRVITYEGLKVSSRPWLIANQLIGSINANPWMGHAVHEWMCTGVRWEILSRGDTSYRMSFEFQHNPDTWNPTVVFIDDRTGKPPIGLVEGKGFKTVRKHPEQNFERIMGVRLQGS